MRAVIMRRFGPPGVLEPVAMPSPVPGRGKWPWTWSSLASRSSKRRSGRAGRRVPKCFPRCRRSSATGSAARSPRPATGLIPASSAGGSSPHSTAPGDTRRVPSPTPRGCSKCRSLSRCATRSRCLRTGARRSRSPEPPGCVPGDTVLVEAAAGGVGTLLVQLARNAGARVVGLARGERKLEIIQELGADVAVDYGDGDWPRRVRDAVGGVDVVFNGVGGDIGRTAFGLLRPGGRFCPFGMASGSFAGVTGELASAAAGHCSGGLRGRSGATQGVRADGAGRGGGRPDPAGHRPGSRAGAGR